MPKSADRRTDRQTAFQLYIIDTYVFAETMIEMFFELSYMTQQSHDMLPCAGYIHKLSVETNMYILTYIYTYVRNCTNIGKIHKSCLSIVYMYVRICNILWH